jgi:hypothetical protein
MQAVVPFGVGAIVDFEDEALMSAGLDAWEQSSDEDILYDERLARRLDVKYFRQPPAAREGGNQHTLPFVRFPYWHFCPKCRALHRLNSTDVRRTACECDIQSPARRTGPKCSQLPPSKRRRVQPVRFVLACREGHIEDFPWIEWVHSKGEKLEPGRSCDAARLFFYATSAGGMAGLRVHCAGCGQARSMLGASGELKGFPCSGGRPWLGPSANEPSCQETPHVLQRGASNVYFARVSSSVLIPPYSKKVRSIIDQPRVWDALAAQRENGAIPNGSIRMVADMNGVPFSELQAAVLAKDTGSNEVVDPKDEEPFRFDEYRALKRLNDARDDRLVTKPQDMKAYAPFLRDALENIVLVESLAETRALDGFSRVVDGGATRPVSLSLRPRPWRPAYRVQGEGIFLEFRRSFLDAWRSELGNALVPLLDRDTRGRVPLPATPELVAIHTLAHLLILRLSFEAGYGSSSIRERLYCSRADGATPMAGLLLYTAAGDADGTLGGLVRLGSPGFLESVFRNAVIDARWCSADPVCRESPGQGTGSLNLAACHACGLLPETSCETGNRLLDRLTIVGAGKDGKERPGLFRSLAW